MIALSLIMMRPCTLSACSVLNVLLLFKLCLAIAEAPCSCVGDEVSDEILLSIIGIIEMHMNKC
jgi:hypothetical protein